MKATLERGNASLEVSFVHMNKAEPQARNRQAMGCGCLGEAR
jgi:hypothetical protein